MNKPFYRATFTLFRVEGFRDQYDADRERTAEVVDLALTGDTPGDVLRQALEHVDAIHRWHHAHNVATQRNDLYRHLAEKIRKTQATTAETGQEGAENAGDPGHQDDTTKPAEPLPRRTGGILDAALAAAVTGTNPVIHNQPTPETYQAVTDQIQQAQQRQGHPLGRP